jgi:4-amino-4-deoxy-L-arabinose transferase-like glycosyltransferase
MVSRLKLGHLIMIFAIVALPFAATFALYYPDERHYTDGAMHMLQHGDWLVPHTGAGAARFEKPILAYWAVAVSWLFLGVNTVTARLPFLFVSCGTIWLTYHMARRFTGSIQTALLAVIILISQPLFFLSAVRNIPDALLTFFIVLSAYGFLRLLALNELTRGAYWMAYGGAAGAALSKGLLGVGIVLFSWAFVYLPRRDGAALKKLLHWPSLITGVVVVAGWFVYIVAVHGMAAWGAFFDDQVTGNIDGHFWTPLLRIPPFALMVLAGFLPWSLAIGEGIFRQKKLSGGNLSPVLRHFILIWSAALVIGFSIGSNVSTRYTLPATPLLAILFADWFSALDDEALIFNLRRIILLNVAFLCVASATIILVAYEWHAPLLFPAVATVFVITLLIGLGLGSVRLNYFPRPEALGLSMLVGWLILIMAAIPVLPSDCAVQTAEVLKKMPGTPGPVLVVDNLQVANRLRIRLGPKWTVVQARKLNPESMGHYKYFVLSQSEAQNFANRGWQVRVTGVEPRMGPLTELWAAIKERAVPEYLDGHGKKVFLAIRQ